MNKIKKIFNLKNVIIMLATLILALISMLNFSVALYSNNKTEVSINLKKGDIINDISVSKNSIYLGDFQNENILLEIFNEDENKLRVINDTTLKLNISVIDDLIIDITPVSGNTLSYSINNENFRVDENNVCIYPSKINIIKGSLNSKSIAIFVISYVILLGCVFLIKDTLKRIGEERIKIWNIVLFLLSIFLIYLSNIYLFMMMNKLLALIPAITITAFTLIYFKFSIKGWKNIFLCVSGIIGVMMIFIITPGNVPDEPSHYTRSYVDSVTITKESKDNVKLPESINSLMGKFTHNVHSLKIKYSGKSYITELTANNNYIDLASSVASYENTKYLSFLPYLPSTIINFICRFIKIPVLITFLFCRLINLIISTILCYYAIKKTPRFKKIFALIAILPVFLQQAAGVDMDFLTNSVSILFIATILKYRFDDNKIGKKDVVILTCEALALALCKFGYFPLLLLILLIPTKKFSNKKLGIIFKVSIFVIPIMISYFANFTAVSNPNTNTEEMYTIKTVMLNPINSAKICLKTFVTRFAADSFCGLVNGFGWCTKYQLELSLWTVGAIYIILLFTDNEDSSKLTKKDRIIMLAICSVIYLILYGVAFTEWTSIKLDKINGLQSRYFIPILPLLYIAISNNFFKANMSDKWKLYSILIFVANILTCISILNAFY